MSPKHIAAVLAALCLQLLTGWASGYSVTLAWKFSGPAAGARLYCGGAARTYTNAVNIGPAQSFTVSNLVGGATYYFAVTAYDAAGLESDYSNEVTYTARPAAPTIRAGNVLVETPVYFWSSTNLTDWHRVSTGAAWAVFPVTNAAEFFKATPSTTTVKAAP